MPIQNLENLAYKPRPLLLPKQYWYPSLSAPVNKHQLLPLWEEHLAQYSPVSQILTAVTHGAEESDWPTKLLQWSSKWLQISLVTCLIFKGHTNLTLFFFKYEKYFFLLNPQFLSKTHNPGRCALFVLQLVGFLGNTPCHHEETSSPGCKAQPLANINSASRSKLGLSSDPWCHSRTTKPSGFKACLSLSALSPVPWLVS